MEETCFAESIILGYLGKIGKADTSGPAHVFCKTRQAAHQITIRTPEHLSFLKDRNHCHYVVASHFPDSSSPLSLQGSRCPRTHHLDRDRMLVPGCSRPLQSCDGSEEGQESTDTKGDGAGSGVGGLLRGVG